MFQCALFSSFRSREDRTCLQSISTVVLLRFKFRFRHFLEQDVESIEFVTEPDLLIMLQPEISLHRHVS